MVSKLDRHRAVSLWVCLGVCLGVSLLLSASIWRGSLNTPADVMRNGRSPYDEILPQQTAVTGDIVSGHLPRCRDPIAKINTTSFRNMRRFTGRKMVTYTSVYPRDGTTLQGKRRDTDGNEVIPWKTIAQLELMYQSAVTYRDEASEFTLIEQTVLLSGVPLYVIETNATNPDSVIQHYLAVQHSALCCPPDFSLDLRRQVVIVATSMNLGETWMQHFIDEFSDILEKTGERNFRITLIDFGSENVDVKKLFDKSILRDRSEVITMDTTYNKPVGVEKAVSLIQNPDDIVFLCDFHLEIPLDFFTIIRKHVIPGQMVFAPVVAKLNKGSTPSQPEGRWDYNGFGLLGISRSDWDVIGGINTRDFSDRWGGEDWDMIDRIIQHGLHVNRLRVPGLLHHYHSKIGMWPGGRLKLSDL